MMFSCRSSNEWSVYGNIASEDEAFVMLIDSVLVAMRESFGRRSVSKGLCLRV